MGFYFLRKIFFHYLNMYHKNLLIGILYQLHVSYQPIFGRLINQTKGNRCDIYLVSDLHIFYYQKRKGLDRSIANKSVSSALIG
jgi:hypothetical protein